MGTQPNQSNDRPRQGSVFSRLKQFVFRGYFPPKDYHKYVIHPTLTGFEVQSQSKPLWTVDWESVDRVVAFKLDRVTTDTVCLGFQLAGYSDRVWCIKEDWDRFHELKEALEAHTDGAWPGMWGAVIQSPFLLNWTEVWERDNAPKLKENPTLIWNSAPAASDPTE